MPPVRPALICYVRVVTLLIPVAFFSAYPNPHELAMVNGTRAASPNVLVSAQHSHSIRGLAVPVPLNYVPIPDSPRLHQRAGGSVRREHRARAEAIPVKDSMISSDGVEERNPEKAEAEYLVESAHTVAVSDKTRDAVKTFSHGFAIMLMVM